MVTIKLQGGLGNQMFQYAFGRRVAIERNDNLRLDISNFRHTASGDTPRKFKLDSFNIKAEAIEDAGNYRSKKISWNIINKIGLFLQKDFHIRFHPLFLKLKSNYFNSFFQSYKYFEKYRKEILEDFNLKTQLPQKGVDLMKDVRDSESVSIHVRRGDYVTNKNYNKSYGVCEIDYYEKAIAEIRKKINNPTFYIFSDDIEWAKFNLKMGSATVFVSEYNLGEYIELELIKSCKHNIIANSTFSWWGAWLNENPNKIVISPLKWTSLKDFDTIDLIPGDWIKI